MRYLGRQEYRDLNSIGVDNAGNIKISYICYQRPPSQSLTQDGLEDFLKDGIPLIALLDPAILYDGIRGFGHFVVITGLERGMVYYHDPDLKRDLCRNVDEFFKAWESCFFKGVKIWKSMRK